MSSKGKKIEVTTQNRSPLFFEGIKKDPKYDVIHLEDKEGLQKSALEINSEIRSAILQLEREISGPNHTLECIGFFVCNDGSIMLSDTLYMSDECTATLITTDPARALELVTGDRDILVNLILDELAACHQVVTDGEDLPLVAACEADSELTSFEIKNLVENKESYKAKKIIKKSATAFRNRYVSAGAFKQYQGKRHFISRATRMFSEIISARYVEESTMASQAAGEFEEVFDHLVVAANFLMKTGTQSSEEEALAAIAHYVEDRNVNRIVLDISKSVPLAR